MSEMSLMMPRQLRRTGIRRGILADLAEQLKADLEKNDRFILSMTTLKKTDDIEKLAKRIRNRLRH